LYFSAIIVISLLPPDDLPNVVLFIFADKLIHCCMYAGLTFLLFWAWPERFNGNKFLIPLLLIAVCGFAMELLQGLLGLGRTFDLLDQLSNMVGFFPGWVVWLWFKKIVGSYSQNK
jgi:hypothetical protein